MIMRHLYLVIATLLFPLLTSCHTKKQAIDTVREEANTSRQTLSLIDSGKLDSMRTSFLAEFDSLVIEMPVAPILCPGASIVPDTATAPPRPARATVYGGRISTETKSVSASSAHTQIDDSLHRESSHASEAKASTDSVGVAKPPDMTIIFIVAIIILAALVYLKFR